MKRLGIVFFAGLALAGCDSKASTAKMPEFYVYSAQPYCLAEVTTSEPDAATRKKDMYALMPVLLRKTQGWREKYTLVGVDYIDFKKFTMVVKGACDDKKAVDLAKADVWEAGKKYTFTVGGDKSLVGVADTLKTAGSPAERFAKLNPDAKIDECLIQFTLPRAAEDRLERVPSAMVQGAVEFHFPVADVAVTGSNLYMLLAHDCGQKDVIAKHMTEVFKIKGLSDKEFLAAKTLEPAGYTDAKKG